MLKEMYWETGIDFAVVSVACCREWSKLMGSKRDVSRLCERCRCDGSDQRDESGGRIGTRQSARADESHAKSAVAGSSGGQRDEFGGALALHFNGELGDGNGAPRSVGSYRDESDARTATIVSSGEEGWMVCALIDWCDWLMWLIEWLAKRQTSAVERGRWNRHSDGVGERDAGVGSLRRCARLPAQFQVPHLGWILQ